MSARRVQCARNAVSEILPGRREAWSNHWQTKQRTVDETNNACIASTAVSLTDDWLRGSPRFDSRYAQLFFIVFRPEHGLTQPPVHWVRGVICLIGKLRSFVWGDCSQRVGHEARGLFQGQREFSVSQRTFLLQPSLGFLFDPLLLFWLIKCQFVDDGYRVHIQCTLDSSSPECLRYPFNQADASFFFMYFWVLNERECVICYYSTNVIWYTLLL